MGGSRSTEGSHHLRRGAIILLFASCLGCVDILGIEQLPPRAHGGDATGGGSSGGSESTAAGGTTAVCTSGETRCRSGDTIERCVASQWTVEACGSTAPACDAGACRAVVGMGGGHTSTLVVTLDNGARWGWGRNHQGQLGLEPDVVPTPTPTPALDAVVGSIRMARYHACVRRRDNALGCWAGNLKGQSGVGSEVEIQPLPPVVVLDRAVSFDVASDHTCAVSQSNEVICWGANGRGELGLGFPGEIVFLPGAPVAVGPMDDVATARHATCAGDSSETVWCWGDPAVAEALGSEMSGTPLPITLPKAVRHLVAGDFHFCAVHFDRTVTCFGSDWFGVVTGVPVFGGPPSPPTTIPELTDVAAVCGGTHHACALDSAGDVHCWGGNDWGAIGTGQVGPPVYPPHHVELPGAADELTCLPDGACVRIDGNVWCWGGGRDGVLGTFETTNRPTPAPVRWAID